MRLMGLVVSLFTATGAPGGDGPKCPCYGAGEGPKSVAIGDLDGDGDPDLAAANADSNNVSVFLNNGDGTFADDVVYDVGGGPSSVAISDLDGDADMAVANEYVNTSISVFLNNGTEDCDCVGDVVADGDIDLVDLTTILSAWGPCDACDADITNDGVVGFEDLLIVLACWGPCG